MTFTNTYDRPAVPRRHLDAALNDEKRLDTLRDHLAGATLGVTTWARELVADHSHLHSPRIDPTSGHGSRTEVDDEGHLVRDDPPTPVESAAFTQPDPLVDVARRYLDAVRDGDALTVASCVRRIRANVVPEALADPCRICGRRVPLRSKQSGECPACERTRQRERERTS